ncbi:GIY-YIG nuclease family protein [Facilibium subflavum]|uniref:GIY-YIG nuclease family protein n=1 Tax=Facilibium subflavum TaxID=2219058 RepID=UPI001AACA3ED|nr:GIY-YIG nuclease family protein [Facilibium subflavum]
MIGKKTHPQTIQIFLPTGDPSGIKVAKITTSIIEAIEVPRPLLKEFLTMSELPQVALYCLVGEDEKTGSLTIYIGKTTGIFKRLKQHHEKKSFWSKAFVFLSMANSFTTTHVEYLESLAIEHATLASRYQLDNNTSGLSSHLPVHLKAECNVFFDVIEILATTLGLPVFKPLITKNADNQESKMTYHCTRRGADAKGYYNTEGFVVLKNSVIAGDITKNFEQNNYLKLRNQLITDGVIKDGGFCKNYLFNSPSAASAVCLGSSSNGWNDWKDIQGRSLNDNERSKK